MSKAFRYPLPADALALFCYPRAGHHLARPMRMDGEIVAANGYVAIRCHRGAWIESEFPEAWTDFKVRVEKLPWRRFEALADEWRALDQVRGTLFRRPALGLWLGGRVAPSPVVRVAGALEVRLSLLQLISRLPRCEVFTGPADASEPLFFRFSGGRGIIAPDRTVTGCPSFSILEPPRDCLTGEVVWGSKTPAPRLVQPGVNWPPADLTDAESRAAENGQTVFYD